MGIMKDEMEEIESGISRMPEAKLELLCHAAGIHIDKGPKHMRERLLGLTPRAILAAAFKSRLLTF